MGETFHVFTSGFVAGEEFWVAAGEEFWDVLSRRWEVAVKRLFACATMCRGCILRM